MNTLVVQTVTRHAPCVPYLTIFFARHSKNSTFDCCHRLSSAYYQKRRLQVRQQHLSSSCGTNRHQSDGNKPIRDRRPASPLMFEVQCRVCHTDRANYRARHSVRPQEGGHMLKRTWSHPCSAHLPCTHEPDCRS